MFPWGCEDNGARDHLLCKGWGGYCRTSGGPGVQVIIHGPGTEVSFSLLVLFSQGGGGVILGSTPPPPCPSPPLVLPQGGVGDRHLLNPKFFVAARCVVVAKPPPKSAAQSIPVESGKHVQEFKVKWSRTKKIYTELVKE